LKICGLPNLDEDDDDNDKYMDDKDNKISKLQVLFENENYHNGSLYCIDWSRS